MATRKAAEIGMDIIQMVSDEGMHLEGVDEYEILRWALQECLDAVKTALKREESYHA
jgi:hypothetical protein